MGSQEDRGGWRRAVPGVPMDASDRAKGTGALRVFAGVAVMLMLIGAAAVGWTNADVDALGSGNLRTQSPSKLGQSTFVVTSPFDAPVLAVRINGVGAGGVKLVTCVILDDGREANAPLQRVKAEPTPDGGWKVSYQVDVVIPEWVSARAASFDFSWRLEYASKLQALSDFPVDTPSFWGNASGKGSLGLSSFTKGDKTLAIPNWLERYHPALRKDLWSYHRESPCKPWDQPRPYSLAIVGDSQPDYMCTQLRNAVVGMNINCVAIKGVLENKPSKGVETQSDGRIKNNTLPTYIEALSKADQDFVLFNPSGLWESAYGSLESYRFTIPKLLDGIKVKDSGQRLFALTTTAVHPYNYRPGIYRDKKKWAMTQVRVQAVNQILRQEVQRFDDIGIIDLEPVSLANDQDPKVTGDMRHFGKQTNQIFLRHVLCTLDATV